MSYTPNIPLNLDIDYAGMAADLRGQLYDGATQATVGGAISGVFLERPGAQAMYIMRPTIPDGHDGWCDIYVDGAPETVIGFFSINPAELENADAKTSTRSTFAGGAVASVTGSVGGNVVGSIGSLATQAKADVNAEADAALVDVGVTPTVTGRIDAAVSSRLASAGYTTPPTVAAIRQEMDTNSTKLANLDATVSSRLATSGYTAPDNATIAAIAGYVDTEVAAIKAKTDNLPSSPASSSDVSNAQTAIADAIDALNDITAADVVTALMAYAVESGKDYATVLRETYAILRGKYEADDADPTSVVYYAPDGATERVTFALTDTTRTPS